MVAGNSAEAEKALQDELDKPERGAGEIILVGAGPGDAGLLTLRGLQAIQQADVVSDHLVTQPVLELVRRDAERSALANAPASTRCRMKPIGAAGGGGEGGKTVVRLKGGDPFIFGRGAKSAGCRRAGGSRSGGAGRHRSRRGRRPTPVFR